jgi:hypothetical protein
MFGSHKLRRSWRHRVCVPHPCNTVAHVLATAFGDRAAWKEMTYSAHVPHLHDRGSNAAKNFISVFEEMMALIESATAAVAAA